MAAPSPPHTEAPPCDLGKVWRAALEAWGLGIDLSVPVPIGREDPQIAYIDLKTRQTHVNFARLDALGLAPHVGAVLAHEVGHHARFPQTLVRCAKLVRRQRKLLEELEEERPGLPHVGKGFEAARFDFLLNLFLDVLINDSLRRDTSYDLPAVYRAVVRSGEKEGPSAVFSFTLALYDSLWGLGQESLLGKNGAACLDEVSRGWREEAGALAREIRASDGNLYLGLDQYVEAIWLYLVSDAKAGRDGSGGALERVLARGVKDLDSDDLGEVVRRTREEERADRAREQRRRPVLVELPPDPEGEEPDRNEARGSGQIDPDELSEILGAGKEFGGTAADASAIIRAYYERLADRILVPLPREPRSDPLVPTTLETWEPSEDPGRIDWAASLGRGGAAIPGITLVEREFEPESTADGRTDPPWIEIYIDSSGSMPDPSAAFSPLAFAGFLLARAAIEAGSQVRIIQYAGPGDLKAMDGFSADKHEIFRALLRYFGSGTQFPFEVLDESLSRFRSFCRIERVALTDTDFFYNVRHREKGKVAPLDVLGRASRHPERFTVILNVGTHYGRGLVPLESLMPPGLKESGIRMMAIGDWNELHGVAADLGREIFGSRGKAG